MGFNEAQLEQAVIALLGEQGYPHVPGATLQREPSQVLIRQDLHDFLARRYRTKGITTAEIDGVIRALQALPAADLYDSNRTFMQWVSDGYPLQRDERTDKDLHLSLIDGDTPGNNVFKLVDQLEIVGTETRVPDAILYVNGLPLVVFEFKSAVRAEATLHDAWVQLTVRYRRDIPALLKYNALCVISVSAHPDTSFKRGRLARTVLLTLQRGRDRCTNAPPDTPSPSDTPWWPSSDSPA